MSIPRLLVRVLIGLAVACAGAVALVGGLYLRGSGLIAVAVSGALVACLAAGIARETPGPRRTPPLEAAVVAGGVTALALLMVSGTAIVSSGAVAALLTAASIGAAVAVVVRHGKRTGRPAPPRTAAVPIPALQEADHGAPVAGLSTRALGREWLRTAALLAGALLPEDRAALVRRRQETLDELEHRDPEGFGRWLTVGGPETDPADYVHGERTAGTDAA